MVADIVRRVGGDRVFIMQLMGAGIDPHLYKPGTRDVQMLFRARLVFYSGLHLEGKMADIFERLGRHKPCVALAEAIPEGQLLELEPGQHDPHVWFDVSLWLLTIDPVQRALCQFDPAHSGEYTARAATYRNELEALHRECLQKTAELNSAGSGKALLVTSHDAFGYLGRAYGLEVAAIQGFSTESEAGVREINDLVTLLVARNVKAVFVETSVSDRNMQALLEGCRARGHEIRIGGELFSDAMGEPGTVEGTYPGMVRHNIVSIVEGLK